MLTLVGSSLSSSFSCWPLPTHMSNILTQHASESEPPHSLRLYLSPTYPRNASFLADYYVRRLRLKVIPRSHDTTLSNITSILHQTCINFSFWHLPEVLRKSFWQWLVISLCRILWPGPKTGDWSLACGGERPSSSLGLISAKINPNALIVFFPFNPP